MVARIGTGEIDDSAKPETKLHRDGGTAGGAARAKALTPEKRKEIAQARKREGEIKFHRYSPALGDAAAI